MDLALSFGMFGCKEDTRTVKREHSVGVQEQAVMETKADHPSLQLELKLPCPGDSEPGKCLNNTGLIIDHGYKVWKAGPSSATPCRITTERPQWRRCGEDDGIGQTTRKKLRLTKEQSCYLEQNFKEQPNLNPKQKLFIAKKLKLQPRQVEVWYQNRRARTKLKQTEMDFEHLKQHCELLSTENQKLQKELEELKTFKFPLPQLCLHSPTTMLALCPSCQEAGTPEMAKNKLSELCIHIKHGEIFQQKLAYQVW